MSETAKEKCVVIGSYVLCFFHGIVTRIYCSSDGVRYHDLNPNLNFLRL